MRWLDGISDSMDMSLSKRQEIEDREGQGSLVCCSPWGHKESNMTSRLNNTLPFPSVFGQKEEGLFSSLFLEKE